MWLHAGFPFFLRRAAREQCASIASDHCSDPFSIGLYTRRIDTMIYGVWVTEEQDTDNGDDDDDDDDDDDEQLFCEVCLSGHNSVLASPSGVGRGLTPTPAITGYKHKISQRRAAEKDGSHTVPRWTSS